MKPHLRRRMEARLGLLGINWAKLAKILKIDKTTLSRYLGEHYTTLPGWFEGYLLHALQLQMAEIDVPDQDFDPACLIKPHPHFGIVCSQPGELNEAARWFRETYRGPQKTSNR